MSFYGTPGKRVNGETVSGVRIPLSPQVEWGSKLFFERFVALRRQSGIQIFSSKGFLSPQAEPKMVSHIHYYIYSQNLDLS